MAVRAGAAFAVDRSRVSPVPGARVHWKAHEGLRRDEARKRLVLQASLVRFPVYTLTGRWRVEI